MVCLQIYQILLGWGGLDNIIKKYYTETNECHYNPKATTRSTKIVQKTVTSTLMIRFWPFVAIFSRFGLALGGEIRWFHIVLMRFPTQHNWVNRKHHISIQYLSRLWDCS